MFNDCKRPFVGDIQDSPFFVNACAPFVGFGNSEPSITHIAIRFTNALEKPEFSLDDGINWSLLDSMPAKKYWGSAYDPITGLYWFTVLRESDAGVWSTPDLVNLTQRFTLSDRDFTYIKAKNGVIIVGTYKQTMPATSDYKYLCSLDNGATWNLVLCDAADTSGVCFYGTDMIVNGGENSINPVFCAGNVGSNLPLIGTGPSNGLYSGMTISDDVLYCAMNLYIMKAPNTGGLTFDFNSYISSGSREALDVSTRNDSDTILVAPYNHKIYTLNKATNALNDTDSSTGFWVSVTHLNS